MINKKYKCPACGNEVECDVYRVPKTNSKNPLYQYILACRLYACDIPFQVGIIYNKPDSEKGADKLYKYWVKEYKKYQKENKK